MNYSANDIKVLDIITAIRERPAMYVGSADENGVLQCVLEIISNSVDEAMNGYGDTIEINLTPDLVTVRDYGRGIPFDKKDGEDESILISLLTKAHSGGKFDGTNYATAGGLHGLGTKCANALSSHFKCVSHRKGVAATIIFKQGQLVSYNESSTKEKDGTYIEFSMDSAIMKPHKFDVDTITKQVKELSYLDPIKFVVNNTTFYSKKGLYDFINDKVAAKERITDIYSINEDSDDAKVSLAFTFVNNTSENIIAYANNIPNVDGGTHVTGAKSALTTQLNGMAKAASLITDNLSGDLMRKGLVMVLNIKMTETPSFTSQTKTKLNNPIARTKLSNAITNNLSKVLKSKDLETIINKAVKEVKAQKAAERARAAEKSLVEGSTKARMIDNLPSKLIDAVGSGDKTLYIVEGDSAAGNLISMRNPEKHGILGLRGKILNTHDKELADILNNKEIKDILIALGCGAGAATNTKKLRYNKIVIAADEDSDGKHIDILLATLFLKHLQPVVEQGYLYKSITPLYGIPTPKGKIYLYSDKELQDYAATHTLPSNYSRYKGLGALSPEETEMVLLNDNTAKFVQLTVTDLEQTLKTFEILMSKKLKARKDFLFDTFGEDGAVDE